MGNTDSRIENGNLIISLSGHIDSSNAPEVESQINAIRTKHSEGTFTLDAQNLEYISSAGLRIILRLSRQEPSLKLINVSSSVYEVLEMTGFSEMIPVEKAFRVLSVEGCEVIGQGSNGKVYRLDPDTIIKVYNNPDSLPEINRERDLARKAFVLGIPTAIPYDVVKVGNSYGSVFELLNAKSFSALIKEDPSKMDKYIGLYVDVLKKIHSTKLEPGEMPDTKQVAISWAEFLKDYLPANQYEKLHALMEGVPERHTMMHGDYHTKNLMMQKDEVLLIDMDTLSMGHPVFELGTMYLGFVGFGDVDKTIVEKFLNLPFSLTTEFFDKATRLYLNNPDEETYQSILNKAKIVGYTRLMRRTIRRQGVDTPEGKPMVDNCKAKLAALLPKVDTLDF